MLALEVRRGRARFSALLRRQEISPLIQSVWKEDRIRGGGLASESRFLIIDTETSSLNPDEGDLLSVGWVEIVNGEIQLSSARHYLLQTQNTVGQSAIIHHLRDCELQEGLSGDVVMSQLLRTAENAVLVFHHAVLDLAYLNRLCVQLCGAPLCLPVVDTLALEKRKLQRRDMSLANGALRLGSCRTRYHLPDYPAHNALMDALATAELLLAQLAYMGKSVRLKDLF